MEAKIWEDATNGNQGPRSKEQTEMNNTLDDSIAQ